MDENAAVERLAAAERIAQTGPFLEIAVGLTMLVLIILIHGVGLRLIVRHFNRQWTFAATARAWRTNLTLAVAIGSLATLHMLETLLFALPIAWHGLFPTLRDSYYYVLENYTTLGDSTLTLPEEWRLLGPIIAMAGVFTFGWTGSVLVSIMAQVGHIDRQQARRDDAVAPPAEPAALAPPPDAGRDGTATGAGGKRP